MNSSPIQEEIEDDGFKFKVKTYDPNKKVQDAQLEKLKEEMGLDDVGKYTHRRISTYNFRPEIY